MSALKSLRIWSEMVKLEHSVFALPFAVIAAFLAGRHLPAPHHPLFGQLALIVVCMVSARSVAMTFNRIVDRQIDARNPRTSGRPLPSDRLTTENAWFFLVVAVFVFLLGCLGFWLSYNNPWPAMLALPVLAYICGYSHSKRFTRWSHYYLGTAIALSPCATWIAVHPGSLGWATVSLCAAVALWIGGFDIIYACQDIEVDRRDGLHSLPACYGLKNALYIARASHFLTVILLLTLGALAELGVTYFAGVGIVAILLFIENAMVRPEDLSRINVAFFTMNGVVGIVLGALTVTDILVFSGPA